MMIPGTDRVVIENLITPRRHRPLRVHLDRRKSCRGVFLFWTGLRLLYYDPKDSEGRWVGFLANRQAGHEDKLAPSLLLAPRKTVTFYNLKFLQNFFSTPYHIAAKNI